MNKSEGNKFTQLLAETSIPLLSDGAMGTVLNARSIDYGHCFDALNLTHPALVAEIHRSYIEAGAQIIQTNTFGANRYKLALHGLEEQVTQINRAGVELVQRVQAVASRDILIAGDVGPLGVRLAPYGRVQLEDAETAFAEQMQALIAAGVDLLILETFSDLFELIAAVRAARQVSEVPVVASMTFTRDDLTLLGDSPAKVARLLAENDVDVIGANCSGGPAQIWRI
ncbi:MAG: homocysteine S-methyltransferase family protein, partial [Anaerolineales bacterium]|nr:homocysteine S-methyltransferase family protein [Anaerolineales bacterium]